MSLDCWLAFETSFPLSLPLSTASNPTCVVCLLRFSLSKEYKVWWVFSVFSLCLFVSSISSWGSAGAPVPCILRKNENGPLKPNSRPRDVRNRCNVGLKIGRQAAMIPRNISRQVQFEIVKPTWNVPTAVTPKKIAELVFFFSHNVWNNCNKQILSRLCRRI